MWPCGHLWPSPCSSLFFQGNGQALVGAPWGYRATAGPSELSLARVRRVGREVASPQLQSKGSRVCGEATPREVCQRRLHTEESEAEAG